MQHVPERQLFHEAWLMEQKNRPVALLLQLDD